MLAAGLRVLTYAALGNVLGQPGQVLGTPFSTMAYHLNATRSSRTPRLL